jgi:lysophospholipase L1-like esterase
MKLPSLLSFATALLLSLPLFAADQPAAPAQPIVVFVGDSTVASGGGWGDHFGKMLGPEVKWINLGANGRSSKSYRDEGLWEKVIAAKPDWVFIQFGHNDVPSKGPRRETDPKTTYRENMVRYVDEARVAGAQVVLVTSIPRRKFNANGKIEPDSLAPYVKAIRALAAEKKTPLIDLNARSVELLNELGPEKASKFNPITKKNPDEPGKPDTTHLTTKGGQATARLVADEVRKNVPEVAAWIVVP